MTNILFNVLLCYNKKEVIRLAIKDENMQVYITLPRELVEKIIDIEAKKEMRTRSKQIAKIIVDHYDKTTK